MKRWQLREAKARLSKVAESARREGPQEISVRGEAAVVVISKSEYERLSRPRPTFVELLRSSPLVGVDLRIERSRTPPRAVPL
ncbi:type II toxin-antitoxin system Phd/YefM family antitoxin [Acidobacteria bacterium ACD]|nr:MAG: type II toxin-antitoxin system Phd/YefM family antitoxin [Acidobacteriota bacterium]MCE7958391.1 type II toxin-antitoxin system Phd/YefM family antitoxin [Acidobacteria bacterium ACB2]MDL1948985.1 type II toxin-antitoxin system Phd/YefM family antitoxin [Acidobacteria bacterium ACD]